MLIYRLKILFVYLITLLTGSAALVGFYSLILSRSGISGIQGGLPSPISTGLSAVALAAPVFAVTDALLSWLKLWREGREKAELIRVIEALSGAPQGLDLLTLARETGLPRKILLARLHELVLLDRVEVKLAPGKPREYSLSRGRRA